MMDALDLSTVVFHDGLELLDNLKLGPDHEDSDDTSAWPMLE